jgi:hypothetical protein
MGRYPRDRDINIYCVDEVTSTTSIYCYNILLGIGTGAHLQISFAVGRIQVLNPEMIFVTVGFVAFAQRAAPTVTLSTANTIFFDKVVNTCSISYHIRRAEHFKTLFLELDRNTWINCAHQPDGG